MLEAATALGIRTGERTLLMPEQLGLEQVAGNRRRVECDERLAGAGTVIVERPCHEFFTRARFSCDENGDTRAGEAPDGAKHLLHRRRAPEKLGNARRARAVAVDNRAGVGSPLHERYRLVDVEGLRQIFECAAFISRYGTSQIGMRRHDNDGQGGPRIADFLQQLEPGLSGHSDIGDEDVRGLAA